MKRIYCNECDTLVAEVMDGSMIRKGTVFYCRSCDDNGCTSGNTDYDKNTFAFESSLDDLMSVLGIKK